MLEAGDVLADVALGPEGTELVAPRGEFADEV
jgi:hypothetical protein